jgi:hypothetical protein
MGTFYYHQKQRIEHSPFFIPSFGNLEKIYQQLKSRAGPERTIQIDDKDYLSALAPKDEVHRDAALIRRYIGVREKQRVRSSSLHGEVSFKLFSNDAPDPGKVAYTGHGIALLEERPHEQ